jgi:hypothetical protein
MCWQNFWLISWEWGYEALRSFLHLKALIKEALFIPPYSHLSTLSLSHFLNGFFLVGPYLRNDLAIFANFACVGKLLLKAFRQSHVYGILFIGWPAIGLTMFFSILEISLKLWCHFS